MAKHNRTISRDELLMAKEIDVKVQEGRHKADGIKMLEQNIKNYTKKLKVETFKEVHKPIIKPDEENQ